MPATSSGRAVVVRRRERERTAARAHRQDAVNGRRIVMVTLEPPAPFGNAAARWYYVLLRELVARGHHVTCFAACSKASDLAEARRLFPSPAYDLRLYPFPPRSGLRAKLATLRRPFSYMFSRELARDLEAELARGYDVLHLEQLWAGWLGLGHVARALVNVHYLPSIDLADTRPSDAKGRRDSWLMGRAERTLLRRFAKFHACSTRVAEGIVKVQSARRGRGGAARPRRDALSLRSR